jgi:HAMP domain-containing protein
MRTARFRLNVRVWILLVALVGLGLGVEAHRRRLERQARLAELAKLARSYREKAARLDQGRRGRLTQVHAAAQAFYRLRQNWRSARDAGDFETTAVEREGCLMAAWAVEIGTDVDGWLEKEAGRFARAADDPSGPLVTDSVMPEFRRTKPPGAVPRILMEAMSEESSRRQPSDLAR